MDNALPLAKASLDYWQQVDSRSRWAGEAAWWVAKCFQQKNDTGNASIYAQRAKTILANSNYPIDLEMLTAASAEITVK